MRILATVVVLFLATHVLAEDAVSAACNKAVDYLSKQQNADGTFGQSRESAMPGVVGLVLESLATSPGKLREDNAVVKKATEYLLAHQLPNGAIAIPEFGLENYNTSVAIIAIAALENPAHKPALDKARDYVLSAQSMDGGEKSPTYGGFGYSKDGKKIDLSNTGFSLEALKAAGVKEDSPAWKNAVIFIKRCQDNSETNDQESMKGGPDSGGFAYAPGESPFGTENARGSKKYVPRAYGNMTYEAIKSLLLAGMKKDDPVMQAAFKWIKHNYAVKDHPGAVDNEGYFYYVLAFTKALTAAGVKELELADGKKVDWAKDLSAHLISIQKADGSFVNANPRWIEGNPVLATSYALKALSLCAEASK